MRLVEPWIKVEKFDGVKIMKKLERACRTCYRSEGSVTEDSYKKQYYLVLTVPNCKIAELQEKSLAEWKEKYRLSLTKIEKVLKYR